LAFSARVIILLAGLGLFVIVFELVRKKRLREELSIIWLLLALIIASGSVMDLVIDPLAKRIGIYYPPALVFMIVIIVLIISFFYFSLVTSDLKSKVKELTQKIALLEFELQGKKDRDKAS
jgi:membrane-associated HD superfamily phosphohydrolase